MAEKTHEAPEKARAPWSEAVPAHAAGKPMTADELWDMPEDGLQYELVEGRLVRMAPPGGTHGEVAGNLFGALWTWAMPRHLGRVLAAETGFHLSPGNVRAADAAFVRAERVPPRDDAARHTYWRLAPDLVGEVASPSQSRADMEETAQAWLAAGTRLVWVAWPETQQVDVWRPDTSGQPAHALHLGEDLDGLDVLPGFTYALAELFA